MLTITTEEKQEAIKVKLEDRLVGPWVPELEKSCIDGVPQLGDRRLIVDRSSLHFINSAGKYMVALIRKGGAILSGSGLVASELIAEIAELDSPSTQCKRTGSMLSLLLIL